MSWVYGTGYKALDYGMGAAMATVRSWSRTTIALGLRIVGGSLSFRSSSLVAKYGLLGLVAPRIFGRHGGNPL